MKLSQNRMINMEILISLFLQKQLLQNLENVKLNHIKINGMNNSPLKKQYLLRLEQLKNAKIKAFNRSIHKKTHAQFQQSREGLLKNKTDEQSSHESQRLLQVIKKIKIKTLVDQFVYKMKRNIVSKQPIEYQKIQNALTQIKFQKNYIKTFNLNEKLIATFMVINIIAILLIQTLSAFQGFYMNYGQAETINLTLNGIQFFCLVVFLLKLIFSFFFNQNINGVRQKYVRNVAKQYFYSLLFVFDFLNFFMTLFKVLFPKNTVIGILCFMVTVFSLPVISKDFEIVEIAFFSNYKQRQYFTVFKIFIFNIFFAQFVSTILMAVSYFDREDNWINKAIQQGTLNEDTKWWQVYFYSMYWAITTLTTIGYGDLTPANYFEVIWVSLMMLIGSAVLSYNLSEIGGVISNLRKIDKRRKEETVIFKRIAKDQNLSQQLKQKILAYIENSAEVRTRFQFRERKKFLDDLPEQLKDQFRIQYSNHTFSKIPFFNLLQFTTLITFSQKLKSQISYPGQFLTKKDGTLPSILFLKHGKVGFAYHKEDSMLNGLILQTRDINQYKNKPYLLNKYLLTSDRQINYQIVASTFCYILILQYEQFYSVLRQSQKDNQFYFSLYSRISYIDQQWDQFECNYCAPKKHTVFLCPKLHYMPYKSMILQKYILGPNISQDRIPIFNRKYYQLKIRKSLRFWKEFYKFIQTQVTSQYYRKGNQNEDKNQLQAQNEKMKQSPQKEQHEFIVSITKEILKSHCCELISKFQIKKEIQIDKMHNFVYFFPQHNPVYIKMLSLRGLTKKRHKIRLKFLNSSYQLRSSSRQ